ncbi:N-methyl-D-aspartate receptor NMDAR2C subunit [Hahella aquimaris]|uniref:HD domain-containing protein n=1 Tax=Hahella sp. HNIBRBA332 TaxID=3015983 RepID=UPI00273C136F|nr:N-methyl-D-aspartate receptor NMDAR2C subunit [Hahella sp. HNIBRBA332]WLQ17134.1 N-methyl-D-aspartate receptor NMDAR2C subunit [Hahella sp. HNIBRBA332]
MPEDPLFTRWRRLFPVVDPATVKRCFDGLRRAYTEPHRHYHTLDHIQACLRHLDEVPGELEDPRAVELALWYHDIVYQIGNADSEADSARRAVVELRQLGETPDMTAKVRALILHTRHPSQPDCHDAALLVDIDLAILGAAPALYDQYEAWIRQEYKDIPWPQYCAGRRRVLQGFLSDVFIYQTDKFRNERESTARANIERALACLTEPEGSNRGK